MSSFLSIKTDVRKKREHTLHQDQKGDYLLLVVNTGFYLNRDLCEKCYCLHLRVLSTSQARTTFIYFHVHYRLKKITIAAFERIHLNIKTTCLLDLS